MDTPDKRRGQRNVTNSGYENRWAGGNIVFFFFQRTSFDDILEPITIILPALDFCIDHSHFNDLSFLRRQFPFQINNKINSNELRTDLYDITISSLSTKLSNLGREKYIYIYVQLCSLVGIKFPCISYNGLSAFLRCHGFHWNVVSRFSSARYISVWTYDENIAEPPFPSGGHRRQTTGNRFLAGENLSSRKLSCHSEPYVYALVRCRWKTCVALT